MRRPTFGPLILQPHPDTRVGDWAEANNVELAYVQLRELINPARA